MNRRSHHRAKPRRSSARALLAAIGLVIAIAGAEPAIAAEADLPDELHSVTVGEVTAHFGGDRAAIPEGEAARPEFAVTNIWFTFAGEPVPHMFRPKGDFVLGGGFEIFSPDGRYVLLLQDRFGPYHIVGRDRLKDYLSGGTDPDFVINGQLLSPSNAGVHENAHWTSASSIEFTFTCCATEQIMSFDLEGSGPKMLRFREVSDLSKGPWQFADD